VKPGLMFCPNCVLGFEVTDFAVENLTALNIL